jgi:hypothetical protein
MRAEFESERIGQCVFEDEFLFDRIVNAVLAAKGAGGLEFERPVALLADVRALEEAKQVFGVERIEGTGGLSGFRRLVILRRREGGGASDCKPDGKEAKSTGAGTVSAQDASPSTLGPSSGECEAERKTALYRRARVSNYPRRVRP